MKNLICLTTIITVFLELNGVAADTMPQKKEYVRTDKLAYKLKLGWFPLGSGNVTIQYDALTVNNRSHDHIYVHTETLGLGNWLSNLNDDYTAVIDAENAKSSYSFKDVNLQRGRWQQWNSFDYDQMKIKVKVKDYSREIPDRAWSVDITEDAYDILGTFLFFKNTDWAKAIKNETIMIKTFYKRKLYRIGATYKGLDKIKFNGQEISAHKMQLVLPDHDEFAKDRPVEIWVSADENHYPIKIESKLFIGRAKCELVSINDEEPRFE